MTSKVERDFIAADLAGVERLLQQMSPEDFLTRMSLESRRHELQEALRSASKEVRSLASAALFFGGEPVVSNRGIESKFGATVIEEFQDIIAMVAAAQQGSALGQRGPVSGTDRSTLHITRVVHGSFGFEFEELDNPGIFDSPLKQSVDRSVQLIATLGDLADDAFTEAAQDVDSRAIEAVRRFLETVQAKHATLRIVSDSVDKSYDPITLAVAVERARMTKIDELERREGGKLEGVLPELRTFEFRTDDDKVLRGKADSSFTRDDLVKLNRTDVGEPSSAHLRVKQILRQGRVERETYILLKLDRRQETA